MKKVVIIVIALLYSCGAYCQSNNAFIYGETGIGYGSHFSVKAAVNSIFDSNRIISVGYYLNARPAPGVPSDYYGGIFGSKPQQTLNMLVLMYGEVFFDKNHFKVRYTLKGGIALGNAKTPTNYTSNNLGTYIYNLGPDYNYSYHTVFNYGIVLNPTIELPISRGFGFSFGAFSIINPISSSVGLEANMLIGKLRNRRTRHVSEK